MDNLVGLGLYTAAEAGRLIEVPRAKLVRWLRGHRIGARSYERLWAPQVDLQDGRVYLGFRDLMDARVAARFIKEGVSPRRVRAAIQLAREVTGDDHPLSTDRFRTDGLDIFLRVVETDELGERRETLLNLFRRQYEFRQVIEPLLKTVDFDGSGAPTLWWPLGKKGHIVVDPARSFGQPIDAETSVPTSVLAAAGKLEGIDRAAGAYSVPRASVKRAMEFEATMERRAAA